MYVLSLILRRHNWQHASKAKGVGHRTNEARARLCIWVFRFLRDNPVKTFKLDPRSFSGRHVDLLMAHCNPRPRRAGWHRAPFPPTTRT